MISIIVIVSLTVLFLHICTWESMVFSFVDKCLKQLPEYIQKPLYSCPICMVPWWGPTVICIGILGRVWMVSNIWQLILILSGSAALNAVLIYFISMAKQLAKTFGESECNCTSKESIRDERLKRLERFVDPLNSR